VAIEEGANTASKGIFCQICAIEPIAGWSATVGQQGPIANDSFPCVGAAALGRSESVAGIDAGPRPKVLRRATRDSPFGRCEDAGASGACALRCVDLVSDDLTAFQKGIECFCIVEKQAVLDHALVVLGQGSAGLTFGYER
jgi:hypothetical protein